jgi:hypothetical protein
MPMYLENNFGLQQLETTNGKFFSQSSFARCLDWYDFMLFGNMSEGRCDSLCDIVYRSDCSFHFNENLFLFKYMI